jgi:hypothetical protein
MRARFSAARSCQSDAIFVDSNWSFRSLSQCAISGKHYEVYRCGWSFKQLALGLSIRVDSAAQYPRHSRTNGEVRWPRNPAKPSRRFSYQTHPTPRIPKETGPIMSTFTCRVFAPVSQENVAPMLVKTLIFTIADAPFTRRIALCTFATDCVPPFQL